MHNPPHRLLPRWLVHAWLRGFLAAALAYAAAVVEATSSVPPRGVDFDALGSAKQAGQWGLILGLTFSHAVIPVFFYRLLFRHPAAATPDPPTAQEEPVGKRSGPAFAYVHMGLWYGLPIVVLGAMTDWLSLLGFPVVWLTTRRGERLWAFLEYGSSSLAVLLVLGTVDLQNAWSAVVVLVQSVLLGLTHVAGRELWTARPTERQPVSTDAVREQAKLD